MAIILPPAPIGEPPGSFAWQDWYLKLRQFFTTTGTLAWNLVDKTGANITDIPIRLHNTLQTIQGGTVGEFYHLTLAEYDELQRDNNVTSVGVNTTLDDTNRTVLVTASGVTVTLPAASTARIGKSWTVILGTTGFTTVARNGSDTLNLPDAETSIQLDEKGASVSLRCLTATSWGIV